MILTLLRFFSDGWGVAQNYKVAVEWYRLAAEQGDTKAQNSLGNHYRNGEGVVQDYATAHAWYNIAASNGDKTAAKNRYDIANILNAEQLAAAQALALKCIESNYKNCTP